jgi:hypothetical protein
VRFLRSKFDQPILCIFKKIIRSSIQFLNLVIFSYVVNIKARHMWAKIYSSKFNMCTSLTKILHFLFSLFVFSAFLRMIPLFFLQIMKDSSLLKMNIYTCCYLYMYFLLSYFYFFPLDDFIMFLALLRGICTSKKE